MNYRKLYEELITRAIGRKQGGYVEHHHIIPRCLGGSNHPSNIAILTAREHYIAHLLLAKIYPDHLGLHTAAMFLYAGSAKEPALKGQNRSKNRNFEWLRKRANALRSDSKWITNGKLDKRIANADRIPHGFHPGRRSTSSIKGYIWATDGETVIRVSKDDPMPDGYTDNTEFLAYNKDRIYVTNGDDNKMLAEGCLIPDGYRKGRTGKTPSGHIWITNGQRDTYIPEGNPIPTGYRLGRNVSRRWYTNGIANLFIKTEEAVPTGFHPGRTFSNMCITDGLHNRRVARDTEIPSGWRRGITHGEGKVK